MLKNIQCSIKDGIFRISFKPFKGYSVPTKVTGKLMQCRFVPNGSNYIMEIVYEIEVPEQPTESKSIASIDLGIDNFATITNNIGLQPIAIKGNVIKSYNQYYNKYKAEIQSELMLKNGKHWSNKLDQFTTKRNNKIKDWMHKASKFIVNWCIHNSVDTLVCGYNKEWKQESDIGKKNNQKFVAIPYFLFVNQLEYKCQNVGINFITTEESYTSGTDFLGGEIPCKQNYDKSRRITRGLFKSVDKIVNADVNGSYQIMMKVFPNAFNVNGVEGVGCHPLSMKIA